MHTGEIIYIWINSLDHNSFLQMTLQLYHLNTYLGN